MVRQSLRGNERLRARIDASLTAAAEFLTARQSEDGAWRSQQYGALRAGPSLTPHVLSALYFLPRGHADRSALSRGVDYLVGLVGDDGSLEPEGSHFNYPVYTAAAASWVVLFDGRSPRSIRAHRAWLEYVRQRQLSADLGWTSDDRQFGGWSYAPSVPRKPPTGELSPGVFESNISATLYGLGALRLSRVQFDKRVYADILIFVQRCQNYGAADRADPRFDDGGFFFSPTDAARNKAGPAGVDRWERQRFHSYGSATADGLRALLQCGLPPDHPRVTAARRWLERNFSASVNPGTFNADREVLRNAYYHYYCWSVAHAFRRSRLPTIETKGGPVRWAHVLAEELLGRQNADGSWSSRFTDAREDDPLVATPFAAAALVIARASVNEGLVRDTTPRGISTW